MTADPENRRTHNARNLGMVVDALQKVGAARSIVVDENDVVLAGNGVVEAAAQAGITRVRFVDVDGTEIVAVRRRGLTPEQKRELAIYDNRAGELAEWNAEQLRADVAAGLDLSPWFSDAELKAATDNGKRRVTFETTEQLGGLEYRVILDCRDESHQKELLERFEREGLACRALIS